MNYSEWDEDYLLNLPSIEPSYMEIKGSKALDLTISGVDDNQVKNTLSKLLSAFANSGGGLIVYGLKNPVPNRPLEVDEGGVSLMMRGKSTKDWLEDVIPHLTDYPITDFEVYPIERKKADSAIAVDKAIFLIEVPNSERAPHQANDNKYYIRAGGKSVPIGHQIVMDITGRNKHPIIELDLVIRSNLDWQDEHKWNMEDSYRDIRNCELLIEARNRGHIYAHYINCFVYIPTQLVKDEAKADSARIKMIQGSPYYIVQKDNRIPKDLSSYRPILPQLSYTWIEENCLINIKRSNVEARELTLLWEAYADNSPMRLGKIKLKDIRIKSRNNQIYEP